MRARCCCPSRPRRRLRFRCLSRADTVTISREEYESYQRYQKLETLFQLVETYYYEDVDEDAMLENAAVGLMAGIGDIYSVYYTKEEMENSTRKPEGDSMRVLAASFSPIHRICSLR